MPWRIRLIDPHRRLVLPLGRSRDGGTLRMRCLAFHRVAPLWPDVFMRMLRLAGVPAAAETSTLVIGDDAGRVSWRVAERWTTIDVMLMKGSTRKQDLIAAAIVKAARYY